MFSHPTEPPTVSRAPLRIGLYLLVLALVLYNNSLYVLSGLLGLVWVGALLSHRKLKKTFTMALLLCGGIFVGNLFWNTGRVVAEIGPLTITDRAIHIASLRALKVAVLVFAAKALFGGRPQELAAELRWLLRPLQALGINTEPPVRAIEETLQALPEVQQRITTRAASLRLEGTSRIKALGLAVYETFIQELQGQ